MLLRSEPTFAQTSLTLGLLNPLELKEAKKDPEQKVDGAAPAKPAAGKK